MNSQKKKSTHY